jgi:hypothetical protein
VKKIYDGKLQEESLHSILFIFMYEIVDFENFFKLLTLVVGQVNDFQQII